MHEYSLVASLVHLVDEQARKRGATRVQRVEIDVGELAGVEVELLKTAYELFSKETICDGVELGVTVVPARWQCRKCEKPLAPRAPLTCADCGAPARLAQGHELRLRRIDLEVPDV